MVTIQQDPKQIAAAQYRNAEMQLETLEKKEESLKPGGVGVNAIKLAGIGTALGFTGAATKAVGEAVSSRDVGSVMSNIAKDAAKTYNKVSKDSPEFDKTADNAAELLGKFKGNFASNFGDGYGSDIGTKATNVGTNIYENGKGTLENLQQNVKTVFENNKELKSAVSEKMEGNAFTQSIASAAGSAWKNAGPIGRGGAKAAAVIGTAYAVSKVVDKLMTNEAEVAKTEMQKEQAMQERAQAAAFLQQADQPQPMNNIETTKWQDYIRASRAQSQEVGNGVGQ